MGIDGGGGSSGVATSEEAQQQKRLHAQLVQLALRASTEGGTGVGSTVAHPVGLSELYKLGKSIGEG
eukprot:5938325-Prymnesium_polylepis.1